MNLHSSKIKISFFVLFHLFIVNGFSQDLMDLLNDSVPAKKEYVYATFKTSRVINGHSVENPANGVLNFIISHRFGKINEGAYELFGLYKSTVRFGLEYGVNDRLAVGIGANSYQKTYDGFIKYKLLRQTEGKGMPISLSLYSSMDINSLKWQYPERKNHFSSRLSYVHQLLIARKFNRNISLQLSPTYIHRNFVPKIIDENDIFALGAGGRYKITNRLSVNGEYFYLMPGQTADEFQNSLSFGVDLETGGHVFQLHITNTQPMFDRAFISQTEGKWNKGDIFFGFNISRVFTIKKPKIK